MPDRRRRAAAALSAVLAGAVLSGQATAPQSKVKAVPVPRPIPSGYGHRPGYGNGDAHGSNRPAIILDSSAIKELLATPAPPTPKPKPKPTKRPADAPDVFETHSTTDNNE